MRPSQEVMMERYAHIDPVKQKRDDRRAQIKCIVASAAQRRRHRKVTLPTLSFLNDKDPP